MIFELKYERGYDIESLNMEKCIKKISTAKNLIDEYPRQWNNIKKRIHKYEYIYTSPNTKMNISGVIPISRSYFKLIEIINTYKLFNISQKVNCFAMAEAPGGFIQSLLDFRNNIDKIYASTLLSTDDSIPYWNRKISNDKQVTFVYGSKKNGDLQDTANLLSLIKELKTEKIHIITGDGGFDYTDDYNKQEKNSLSLIYGEIFLALNIQAKNGVFICKVFDLFLKETIKLVYILTLSYEKVYIHKPCTSRISNSERYLVCIGFRGYNKDIINILFRSSHNYDISFKIDSNYEKMLEKINEDYMNIQIQKINTGINLIQQNRKGKPSSEQIESSKNWCENNNIPINESCLFLKANSHL